MTRALLLAAFMLTCGPVDPRTEITVVNESPQDYRVRVTEPTWPAPWVFEVRSSLGYIISLPGETEGMVTVMTTDCVPVATFQFSTMTHITIDRDRRVTVRYGSLQRGGLREVVGELEECGA